MKQRFTFLDIRAIVNELKPILINKFIQNVYSTQQRLFYVKFSTKDILLIEPGIRIHLTNACDTGISHFCNILRKKTRRDKVLDIYQIGFDRVIVIELSRQKLVIEFFSGGNIFILDSNNIIVEVFRVVKDLNIVKGAKYLFNEVDFNFSFENFINLEFSEFMPFDKDLIKNFLHKFNEEEKIDLLQMKKKNLKINVESGGRNMGKELEDNTSRIIEDNTNKLEETSCRILEDVEKTIENMKLEEKEEIFKKKFSFQMNKFMQFIENIKNFGGIQLKKGKMIDVIPYNIGVDIVYGSFNKACDEYFMSVKKVKKPEIDKKDKIKQKQLEQIQQLVDTTYLLEEKSCVIEKYKELIKDVIFIHQSALKNKVKWEDFEKFRNVESAKGNVVAQSIVKSDFEKQVVFMKLERDYDNEKDVDVKDIYKNINNQTNCIADSNLINILVDNPINNEDKFIELEIDFTKSVHANIELYYQRRKKILDKIERTKHAMDTFVIKTYKKEEKIKIQRPIFWFEKFHFCFTTDKNLIIGGKNSQQNEILVKKHLEDSDLYFHTETSGGSSIILKGKSDISISEAGLVSLCNSVCWDKNVVSPVFYVTGIQVSKTPPTGLSLSKGSFMIRGQKTYLSPYKLEYGLGLLWKVLDTSELEKDEYVIHYDNNIFIIDPKHYEIEFCFPVCAPYIILRPYKYKVRLVPGKDKKGKVVQKIIKLFTSISDERIHKYIKRISADEFVNVLPTNVKIGKEVK